jgi:hypothetical protein
VIRKNKKIRLGKHERIIAVTPEYASGPGWTNRPLWVHIVNYTDKTYRCECLQPEEQTEPMHALFSVGAAAHQSLLGWVEAITTRAKP